MHRLPLLALLAGGCATTLNERDRLPVARDPVVTDHARVENPTDAALVLVAEEHWRVGADLRWLIECSGDPRVVDAEVIDDALVIGADDPHAAAACEIRVRAGEVLEVEVSGDGLLGAEGPIRGLERLTLSGAGNTLLEGVESETLELFADGVGMVQIGDLRTRVFRVEALGDGGVGLSGRVSGGELSVDGAGNVQAKQLLFDTLYVNLAGSGNASVAVRDTITGQVTGSGDLDIYGSPDGGVAGLGEGAIRYHAE